ncbi:hypothetical protein NOR51B_2790 [Luminiphilus syltensis NOR5-1B]|uniref:Uncharacterized protein n=1 Tax=Luminiphilus syltensis NOR5-1B TaxID=565045 RepID=B8KVF9_9GAMM|nr:hypothetical protein NOR51B_2790 [Luminiphilus syltensis NOR5-1B]
MDCFDKSSKVPGTLLGSDRVRQQNSGDDDRRTSVEAVTVK